MTSALNVRLELASPMFYPIISVWVSPLVVKEMKRIIESSEIVKEEDTNWPKKNIVGKQELEIRIGNDHISFEVCANSYNAALL